MSREEPSTHSEVGWTLSEQILRQPCPSRYVQNLRELVGQLVPRASGGGVAGRCEREGRLRENLTEERIGRRDCKFPPRANYSCGQMLGQPLKS